MRRPKRPRGRTTMNTRKAPKLIADEVDIVQFAEKLEAVIAPMIRREEHQRCVTIVGHMNPEVAKGLNTQRP